MPPLRLSWNSVDLTWNSAVMSPLLSCFEFHFRMMNPSGSMIKRSATSSYGKRSVLSIITRIWSTDCRLYISLDRLYLHSVNGSEDNFVCWDCDWEELAGEVELSLVVEDHGSAIPSLTGSNGEITFNTEIVKEPPTPSQPMLPYNTLNPVII